MTPKTEIQDPSKMKLPIRDIIYIVGFLAVFWANYQVNQYKIDDQCKRIEALEQFKEKVNVDLINEKINKIQSDVNEIKTMFVEFLRDADSRTGGRR